MISPWVYNLVGNVGVILCLGCFFGIQVGKISPKKMTYSALNFIGSLLIIFSLYFAFNLSAFIIEIAWLLISFYGMCRIWKNKS
ncbi:hypothetical protein L3V82_06420 [Thiotrichales bacterium 19S3-7]|nr:hypothetical protein [Thiotrichales bacterium 19S3-7]MCF6801731.1 hypothetical protein [Thiotrichales bacterium 19S3-11]